MSALPAYHQFLGNGIDALLIGPSGAMCPDAARGLDRCYWYKADLYYPDSRRFAPGADPWSFHAAPPGGTNFQLAPLARAWYMVRDTAGHDLPLTASSQRFDPATGVLHTSAHYGDVPITLRTTLAADLPALCFDLEAPTPLTVRAHAAPGLWPEDREQTDPTAAITAVAGPFSGCRYQVGEVTCVLYLLPAPLPGESAAAVAAIGAATHRERTEGSLDDAASGLEPWLELHGRRMRWWVVLESSRYPQEAGAHTRLPAESRAIGVAPAVEIPDADFSTMHAFSMYMFRAMQHRYSGGIPVNNLRRTFNSHVFWDGAFVQRALLEAGHIDPAREAWRFLARTSEAAAANARSTFGAPGMHWDWETTHSGLRAYVPWMQQRFQVHNTPLLAHMVMADYRATRDRAVLAEGYPLLAGAAAFLLCAVLVAEGDAVVTRPLVGSHESAAPVVNDGATVAASLRLLRDLTLAARLLGRDDDLARQAASTAPGLRRTLDRLYNGSYFQASRDENRLNTSSLTPMYPADVIAPTDPRARATAAAYRARYAGRMAGHGNSEDGFPWSAGLLARLLAYQGDAGAAWEQLELARVALCAQGGCAEYIDPAGHWNMQYFSTAQATLCSALHALLVQQHGGELRLFPALPPGWDRCAFRGFLFAGLRLDGVYERGRMTATVRNETAQPRRVALRLGPTARRLSLAPGEQRTLEADHG